MSKPVDEVVTWLAKLPPGGRLAIVGTALVAYDEASVPRVDFALEVGGPDDPVAGARTEMREPIRIEPCAFLPEGGIVEFGRYGSGELALYVTTVPEDEEIGDGGVDTQCVVTVSLVPYGAAMPPPGCVWIKTWSENEGIRNMLVEAGIAFDVGPRFPTGFVEAELWELTARVQERVRLWGG